MKLNIDLGSCVKALSKNSNCTNCADICPENSITFLENIPQVANSCTDCGLCLGVCPTEAITLKGLDTLDSIFGLLERKEQTLTCEKDIPCIGIYHVEHLFSLALLNAHQNLTLECCETCYEITQEKVQEVNNLLESLQSSKQIEAILTSPKEEEPQETADNRRDFLKRLSLKGAIKSKIEFEKAVQESEAKTISDQDSANMREKKLPNKRKLLYMALKRVDKIDHFESLSEEKLSFISQKSINESCDNCSICYRICPTGALQTDRKATFINFDALACVKCRLCHDVCEKDSITLDNFNTKSFFQPKIDELIKFKMMRCEECSNYFTYLGGEVFCPRCKIEEEEAKNLWGIQ